jgi:hypothetical protein
LGKNLNNRDYHNILTNLIKEGFTMMATKYVFLSTVLIIALTMLVFGQDTYDNKPQADMKHHDLSGMMGKPTVDVTVEGLHMQVWLITQEQHKEMMKGQIGQIMMEGDRGGAMGRMEMKGTMDSSTAKGMVMKEMKDAGKATGKAMKEIKHTNIAKGEAMREMKHDGMEMGKATKEAMMSGTHHIMLDVTDATSGKEIANADAKVLFVSPSKKDTSVDLAPVMTHFGGGLILDEKGEYEFTVSVNVEGVSRTTQFQYTVN